MDNDFRMLVANFLKSQGIAWPVSLGDEPVSAPATPPQPIPQASAPRANDVVRNLTGRKQAPWGVAPPLNPDAPQLKGLTPRPLPPRGVPAPARDYSTPPSKPKPLRSAQPHGNGFQGFKTKQGFSNVGKMPK